MQQVVVSAHNLQNVITLLINVLISNHTCVTKDKTLQTFMASILFQLGLFAHAVYTPEGDYPPIVRELYDKVSSAQGYYKSRLLHFTPEEITTIRGG